MADVPVVDTDLAAGIIILSPTFEDILGYMQDVRTSLITISRAIVGNGTAPLDHIDRDLVDTLIAISTHIDDEVRWMLLHSNESESR